MATVHIDKRRLIQLFNSRRQKHDPAIAAELRPNHLWGESALREAGFEIVTIPAFRWPLNPAARMHNAFSGLDPLRALKVLLTQRRASIICAHLESAVLILLMRRIFLFKPPIVIWEVPWSPGWVYREAVSRLAIPRADCSIVFSSNQISEVRSTYGVNVSVEFVPFCVDTVFFTPQDDLEHSDGYILTSGLDLGRDFSILLEATEDIRRPIMIKAPSHATMNLRKRENVTIITSHLSFIDYRDLYVRAAIVVISTRQTVNASGVTSLLEAMAMGKPVIVSNNLALRDYLPPSDAGIVVPVGDVAALRSAILEMLGNPHAARQMGNKAREFVLSKFNPVSHFRVVGQLFNSVIEDQAERTRRVRG